MGEAIVVAPDGFTRWGGAQYLDSPAIGDYETHVVREVIPAIDARFRTVADARRARIGGKSSGGFGALVLAMRHPDAVLGRRQPRGRHVLRAVARCPTCRWRRARCAATAASAASCASSRRREKKDGADFTTMMVLAQAGAYSPDPARAHGVALPFDLDTGEIDWTVWRRWKAWDPVEMVGDARRGAARG